MPIQNPNWSRDELTLAVEFYKAYAPSIPGVTVEVAFNLDRDGSVRGNDVRLLSSQGDSSAVGTAFEDARQAILRCQSGGYQLPTEKYDQWQEVVITFDPSGMRLR